MKRIYLPLSVAVVLALGLVACGQSNAEPEKNGTTKTIQPVSVVVQEVQPVPFIETIQVTGIIKAYEDVMLSPEEGGVVKVWRVKKGERASKGQIVVELNDEVLKASFEAAEAQYKLAELNFDKQQKIFEEQAISELQLKSSQYNRDAAKAQAELARARLERTRLRSPIDGVLNDRFADEGEFAPPAVPIAHLVNSAVIKVVAEVPEVYSASVVTGAPVMFTVDALPGDTLTGRVAVVGAAISPSNRTLPVEIVVPNPGNKLKPEMIARVRISRGNKKSTVLLNQSIVQQVDRDRFVVYVEKDGLAVERTVRLGGRQGNMVEVVEGLAAGDRVIVAGFQKLVDGQPVRVNVL